MKRGFLFSLVVCLLAGQNARADLVTYGFERVTNNASVDIARQLRVDVTNEGLGAGQVAFIFRNDVGVAGDLAEVYFDDGTLLGIAQVINSGPTVTFSQDVKVTPNNLPGANLLDPDFQTTAGFAVDSGNGSGVGTNEEWVKIIFNLKEEAAGDFFDFQDVIAAINLGVNNPFAAGTLRLGIHVRGIDGGTSDSYVLVPLPAATLLGILGFAAAGLKLRKFV